MDGCFARSTHPTHPTHPTEPGAAWWIDTQPIKQRFPIEEVLARYGIDLRPSGQRTLVGRCPFHHDLGRPNLVVYPATDSFFCFRCAVGGDCITFVRRIECLGFREAVARLCGSARAPLAALRARTMVTLGHDAPNDAVALPQARTRLLFAGSLAEPPSALGASEHACLEAAVELYRNRLWTEPRALAYVERRGIDRRTIDACRVGYAAGDELAAYLRWRRLPVAAAQRAGLLCPHGRELFAGRVVVPELRAGRPIWMIGRTIAPGPRGPKYLALPGPKPLLGWEFAVGACGRLAAVSAGDAALPADEADLLGSSGAPWAVVAEGVFDWLALRGWGYPALALVGTHARADLLDALRAFQRLYLVLDNDAAGQMATCALLERFAHRAIPVALDGVKDVADLAVQTDGRSRFAAAIRTAAAAAVRPVLSAAA